MVKNAYPDLPEVPYQKTLVSEPDVVTYLQSSALKTEIKRATYVVFAIESAHGTKGVNNNYAGIQADGSKLPAQWASKVVATCTTPENMTGKQRRFVCFDSWKDSVDYLADRVQSRGIYIGGIAHPYSKNLQVMNPTDFGRAYWKEWVQGDNSEPPADEISMYVSLYQKASFLFV
jgi:hypothetical protein